VAIDTRDPDLGRRPARPDAATPRRPWGKLLLAAVIVITGATVMLSTAHNGVTDDPRIANPDPAAPLSADHVVSGDVARARPPLFGVENWPSVFTILFGVVAITLAIVLGAKAWRDRRMSSTLMLFLAVTGLCWLDPYGNWATFTVYDPRFTHFPTDVPWFSLAPAIEPLMVVPGYPFYWFPPALFAAWLYKRHISPRAGTGSFANRRPLVTLFAIGFGVGFIFDGAVELFMIRADMYSYTQWWGPAISWNWVKLPVYVIALDAAVFATVTALLWQDDTGRSTTMRLVDRVRLFKKHPVLGETVGAWAIVSVAAIIFLMPFAFIRLTDSATQVNGPWRYSEIKTYDPDGHWVDAGAPGPFYPGIWSLGHADGAPTEGATEP
jgi:hypothetical protein